MRTRLAVVMLALTACEAVPDIRFVADGGTSDGADPNDDGGADAGACVEPAPPGATCCGSTWCTGCTALQCTECAGKCVTGEVCCATPGTINCRSRCN